jgi:hypothetical protein
MDEPERRSKLPKLDSNKNDLMARISSFLPQLVAANQELLLQKENPLTIDAELEKQNDDSSSSSSSSDDSDSEDASELPVDVDTVTNAKKASPDNAATAPKTIQLTFAIGNVEENPGISWIARAENDNHDTQLTSSTTAATTEPVTTINELVTCQPNTNVRKATPLIQELP